MTDEFSLPSDETIREVARREKNFWDHAFPEWMKLFTEPEPFSPTKSDVRVWYDEPAFIPPIHQNINYVVKDPKQPYRRNPHLPGQPAKRELVGREGCHSDGHYQMRPAQPMYTVTLVPNNVRNSIFNRSPFNVMSIHRWDVRELMSEITHPELKHFRPITLYTYDNDWARLVGENNFTEHSQICLFIRAQYSIIGNRPVFDLPAIKVKHDPIRSVFGTILGDRVWYHLTK